ncbi:MAG TPA: arsenate reductase family protein [Solirubrobacteraceae bacterium]|nr:arsenate reductase family protein [Solirubrobacteraceae bacterium]
MGEELTIWGKSSCSKCRGACDIIEQAGSDTRFVDYLEDTPSRDEIERILALLGSDDPRTMMRVDEPLYAELGLAEADRDELLDAMSTHPSLIQRPIAIKGDRAVIARPPERVLELLDAPA